MNHDSTSYLRNLETATRSTFEQGEIAELQVPGLTILAHPDPGRIGERVALPALVSGQEVKLSRLEPLFSAPGDERRRPLADPHLSRRPLRLTPGFDSAVHMYSAGSTRVVADDLPLNDHREFSRQELETGVVLLLADRVTLLLHYLPPIFALDLPDFGLVGHSEGIAAVRQQIARIADLEVPALLRGETGTGKELVAGAIHQISARRNQPFVAINMGAVPPSLAAAELFGAAKGAYTGADRKRRGHFEQARGGTLFMDEVGETPPEVQALLLRSLETKAIQPVGSETTLQIDVRILAATDAHLEAEIEAGRFRAPLLHRLSGYEIWLPPLRQRRDDIGRLLVHFLRQELSELGELNRLEAHPKQPAWLPAPLVARLAGFAWPGNVRQLRNIARQLVIANRGLPQLKITPQIEHLLSKAPTGETRPLIEQPTSPRKVVRTLLFLHLAGDISLLGRPSRDGAVRPPGGFVFRDVLDPLRAIEVPTVEGSLLLFDRPLDAVTYALAAQAKLRQLSQATESQLTAHIALHLGETYAPVPGRAKQDRAADFETPASRMTQRLATWADNRILLTRSVYDLIQQATHETRALALPAVRMHQHGKAQLGETDDLVSLYEVGLASDYPFSPLPEAISAELASDTEVDTADTPAVPVSPPAKKQYRSPSEVDEHELLAALRQHAFRLQPAAAFLRVSRTSLYALIEKSDRIRKARDLSKSEIEACRQQLDGDMNAMAAALEVSRKGLHRRMTQLGMH